MIRVIPRLDVKNDTVVKGIRFEGLRTVGQPLEMAHRYYQHGADEIFYEDVVASLFGRNGLLDIVSKTCRDVFIPMTVGGGLRKLADIGDALQSGADKVSINTAALAFPDLLREAAYTFGSQAIVLSVQAKRRSASFWEAFGESGREPSGRSVVEWVAQAIDLGVGEVLLTSIDKDGTRSGFDLPLIRAVAETCSVPLMVSGGAGSVEHIIEVVSISGVDAVVAGSVLHYGNLTIPKIKEALNNAGFATRPASEAPIVSENEHCGNRTGATDKE